VEHQEAIETHAAEGYLLGDLTAAEHEAFEEHFADCETCFADVRDGATVVAAVRADARAEKPVRRGLRDFFPTFAAAASIAVALLTMIGYQAFELAEMRKPHLVPVGELPQERRGPEEKPLIVNGRADFILNFDITLDLASAPFACKIVDSQGKTHGDPVIVTAEQARKPVDIEIPGRVLAPGDYSLIVTGTGGVSVPEKRFKVE